MKTITIPDELWKALTKKKVDMGVPTLAEVIREILNRDHQGKKK